MTMTCMEAGSHNVSADSKDGENDAANDDDDDDKWSFGATAAMDRVQEVQGHEPLELLHRRRN